MKQYLNRKDVAKELGVSITTVYKWTQKGILKFSQFGFIKRSDLDELMKIAS